MKNPVWDGEGVEVVMREIKGCERRNIDIGTNIIHEMIKTTILEV